MQNHFLVKIITKGSSRVRPNFNYDVSGQRAVSACAMLPYVASAAVTVTAVK